MLQARLETPSYLSRLGAVWLGFFALVAGPIAFQTFDPSKQVQQQHHALLPSMLIILFLCVAKQTSDNHTLRMTPQAGDVKSHCSV